MKNKNTFESGEANEWFRRNIKSLESKQTDVINMLAEWLNPFAKEITEILEIGCGSGHYLNQISRLLMAKGHGVDPSSEAVDYINTNFPNLKAQRGFGDTIQHSKKFDLVHLVLSLFSR